MSIAKIVLNNNLTPEEYYGRINSTEGLKMNITKQVVILSATRPQDSIENTNFRTNTLRGILGDIRLPFNEATGVYKGQQETSFVVVINDEQDLENLKSFAFKSFDQESILLQDSNQEAYLIYSNNRIERLGRLEQVSKEVAQDLDSYTIMNNNYYAVPNPSR